MIDKEKIREFESWLKNQIEEANKRCIEAYESGSSTAVSVEVISGFVLTQVLNKLNEIERS